MGSPVNQCSDDHFWLDRKVNANIVATTWDKACLPARHDHWSSPETPIVIYSKRKEIILQCKYRACFSVIGLTFTPCHDDPLTHAEATSTRHNPEWEMTWCCHSDGGRLVFSVVPMLDPRWDLAWCFFSMQGGFNGNTHAGPWVGLSPVLPFYTQ